MESKVFRPNDESRERQLWCAVVFRAVQDATLPDDPGRLTSEQKRHRDEARRWFAENSGDYRNACESAGFDSDCLRSRVLRLRGPVEISGRRAEIDRVAAAAEVA